ncbi:MAG: hypothetical protein H6696_16625 [Deferribacteres bacterium]|nr:hypothetical protein [candidate division KSB1 bacterium]MCB9503559.1 hypothetical protein [Deferribacteres bacterium]
MQIKNVVLKSVLILSMGLLFLNPEVDAQPSLENRANRNDVNSFDNIITALYDVISGPAGEQRDWDRFRSLMQPSARLMPVFTDKNGVAKTRLLTPEAYITQADSILKADGFFESEIARKIEQYGNLVHVFSTYESRHKAGDPKPFARGINSIQIIYEQDRWWIANIIWQPEQSGLPIPEKYLREMP